MLKFVFINMLVISASFASESLSLSKKIISKDCDKEMTRIIISTINENQMIFSCKTTKISVLFTMKEMRTDFIDKKSNKSFLQITNVSADKETPLDELQKVYALSREHDEMLSVKKFNLASKKEADALIKKLTEAKK